MTQLTAATLTVDGANGTTYAYRRFGPPGAVPVVFLQCFRGNMDLWDPILVDGIAAEHEVITVDASGVGASTGKTPHTIRDYALDILAFTEALELSAIDLLGFSMGGFVAQEIALLRPYLVRHLILVGTGPQGGRGIHQWSPRLQEHLFKDEQDGEDLLALFFAPSETSRKKGMEYIERIYSRQGGQDTATSMAARDAQIDAIAGWGVPVTADYARLEALRLPTLVASGDQDVVVPTPNSFLLAGHIPNAQLVLYPDAAHASLFQYPEDFSARVNEFLAAKDERLPELTAL